VRTGDAAGSRSSGRIDRCRDGQSHSEPDSSRISRYLKRKRGDQHDVCAEGSISGSGSESLRRTLPVLTLNQVKAMLDIDECMSL
jgi:hypothetical protein